MAKLQILGITYQNPGIWGLPNILKNPAILRYRDYGHGSCRKMAFTGRSLRPIRASFSALYLSTSSLPRSTISIYRKCEQLKTWVKCLEPALQVHASRLQYNLNIQRKYMHHLSFSGRKLILGSIFGMSIVTGSLNPWPCAAYAIDGTDILTEEDSTDLWGASVLEDDPHTFWALARKFWLPTFLLMTVWMSWDHPLILAIKVILFLLSTKPSPFSIYLFVEQVRRQSMRQDPFLYRFKSFYAKKVEVQDYKLLCLARVELRDQKMTLIGMLGSWWVLPSSPFQGGFPALGI